MATAVTTINTKPTAAQSGMQLKYEQAIGKTWWYILEKLECSANKVGICMGYVGLTGSEWRCSSFRGLHSMVYLEGLMTHWGPHMS